MYSKSAHLYDEIYCRMKNYEEEAGKIEQWIKKCHPKANTLLDVACGTAEHIKYLKLKYQIDGVDITPEFVEIAKKKNPECKFFKSDMTNFNLGKTYDVITCMFSAIGYAMNVENLNKTLRCFKKHLNRGGLLLVEPWFRPDQWNVGKPHMQIIDEPLFKVCRANTSKRRDNVSIIDFHFIVATDKDTVYFEEVHELGLFTDQEMRDSFEQAELDLRYDEKGIFDRGLYIGKNV